MTFSREFLRGVMSVAERIDADAIERLAVAIARVRERGGRLFFLGVGGGAGHASHAVADFRNLAGVECYAATDNVTELTARINDDGWDASLAGWLRASRLGDRDAVLVFSVGGGDRERRVSVNLVHAVDYAKSVGALVMGVVGRDGGYTARVGDVVVIVPVVDPARVTPHTEAFQAVVWHLLVTHPALQATKGKWESLAGDGGQ